MKASIISQAPGSCYLENGETKVICGVYGPKQSKKGFSDRGSLWCDFKYSPFAFSKERRKQRGQADDERANSLLLSEALSVSVMLEKFPKSVIEVFVQVLEAGSKSDVLACAISCISVALANAGVECYDVVSACSVAYANGRAVLDPTAQECEDSEATMVLSYMSGLNQITHVHQTGSLTLEQIEEMSDLCLDGCGKVHTTMKQCLVASR